MHKKMLVMLGVVTLLLAGAVIVSMADFEMNFTLGDGTDRDVCIDFDLASGLENFCWIDSDGPLRPDQGFRLSKRLLFDARAADWDNDFYLKVTRWPAGFLIYYQSYDKVTDLSQTYASAVIHRDRFTKKYELVVGSAGKRMVYTTTNTGLTLHLCEGVQCAIDGQFNALGVGFSSGGIIQKGIELRSDGTTSPYYLEAQASLGGGDRQFRIAPGAASGSAELQWFPKAGATPSHTLHKASGQPELFFHHGIDDTTEYVVGLEGMGFWYCGDKGNIVASSSQTQAGGTALTHECNFIDTVVTNGDSVTLAMTITSPRAFLVCNGDFAQSMALFPQVGSELLGQGVNNSVTVAPGECVKGIKGDPGTGWQGWFFWI